MIFKEEHVKQLEALANPGADELFYLGECYYFGKGGVEENHSKAFQLFQQAVAVDPSNGKALYRVARCYKRGGYGTDEDEAQARRLHVEAFRQLQQQAEAVPDDAHAQFLLALCYDCGDGVTKDKAKAFVWYKKSAMQGHAEAQHGLGCFLCYERSIGIDKVASVCWFAQAAQQGDVGAKRKLDGLIHEDDDLLDELMSRANKRSDFLAYSRANLVLLFQDFDSVLDELMKRATTNHNYFLVASALAYIYDKGVVGASGYVVAANAERALHWKQRAEQCSESIPAEWLPTCLR